MKAGIGAKHGLVVKLWEESGTGVEEEKGVSAPCGGESEEVALVGYSSFQHFADMLSYEEYWEVNLRLRLPILKDTCILMTSEGS
jgi:hypothetical protein